jgi:NADPH-dependent 2,4-dienoyl-CoA reductase/sulfur reductase-like enzyme
VNRIAAQQSRPIETQARDASRPLRTPTPNRGSRFSGISEVEIKQLRQQFQQHGKFRGEGPRNAPAEFAQSGRTALAPERFKEFFGDGPQMGDFVRTLHEKHGVVFHLQDSVNAIDGRQAMLKSGGLLDVDFIVVGVGMRPRVALAEEAGLAMDRGIAVNPFLETSVRGVYAAGDIARWPDPHSGDNIRVEHWVVAERQGQTAAANMLGLNERFNAVPFFWSQHYDVPINYVGHAEQWDEIEIDGDIKARDCLLRYKRNGRVCAVASIFRDVANLQAELAMERAVASRS